VPPLPEDLNTAGIREILAQALLDVRSNTLAPRAAGALAQLSNALLKVNQVTELEARIAKLESSIGENLVAASMENGSTLIKEDVATNHCPQDNMSPSDGPSSHGS
jgi:hypothetical protein